MEEKKESFHYTYSAKQQEEIQSIRKKYLPQEDKMEQLRRLDRSTTRKGTVVSVIVGVISCLLLGLNTFSFPEKRIAVESEIEKWSPAYSEQLKDFSSFGYKLTGDELKGLSKRDFEAWEYSACNADEDSPMLEYSKAQMLCVDGRTVIPVRYAAEILGYDFELTYDNKGNVVAVTMYQE